MPITDTDIKLLASERLTDDPDGGGFMTGTVVQDGVENNLFEDISQLDRTLGKVRLRKCYLATLSDDRDAYLGAHVLIDEAPSDPATRALIVSKGGISDTRADIVGVLDASSYKVQADASKRILGPAVITGGVTTTIVARYGAPATYQWVVGLPYTVTMGGEVAPGDVLGLFTAAAADPIPPITAMEIVRVKAVAPSGSQSGAGGGGAAGRMAALTIESATLRDYNSNGDVSYNTALPAGYDSAPGLGDWAVKLEQDTGAGGAGVRFYGVTATTDALDIGDVVIPVASTWEQYIPIGEDGTYPTVSAEVLGVDPEPFVTTAGRVGIFRRDEALVVHHTVKLAPQMVANGQTINAGRPDVSQWRVIGADGAEIKAGFTQDLPAGTLTFIAVAGYAQPVTISHRIEDMLMCTEVTEGQLRVNRPVAHAFPSGAKVSSAIAFGDMQARAHPGFQQQAWTGVWSDERIGADILADYNEAAAPMVVTNEGAITERWAFIFTSATAFRVVGEQVGEVVNNGSTAVPTAPTNPATGAPYFTLPSTGWGTGWAAGNVYRRNTTGANAPLWVIRSTAPSDPHVGQDGVLLAIRGSVNA